MERSKPAASAQEAMPTSSSPPAEQSSLNTKSDITTNTVPAATNNASSDDRVRDLERRLDALDSAEKNTTAVTNTNTTATAATIADSAAVDVAASSYASSKASSAPNPLLVGVRMLLISVTVAVRKFTVYSPACLMYQSFSFSLFAYRYAFYNTNHRNGYRQPKNVHDLRSRRRGKQKRLQKKNAGDESDK